MTDRRTAKISLITRMQDARVIAARKGRHDLAAQCLLKISTLQSIGGFNPSYVAGVEMIERDCRDAITMDEVRARHARLYAEISSSPSPVAGGSAPQDPGALPTPHTNRKAA